MPDYTIRLTDEQELALLYESERQTMALPPTLWQEPLTPAGCLQELLTVQLDLLGMGMRHALDPLLTMIAGASPEVRPVLIAGVPRPSLRTYLERRFGVTT